MKITEFLYAMKTWILAVIVACNVQLMHKTLSSQIHQVSSMLNYLSVPFVTPEGTFPSAKTSIHSNYAFSPYSELSKQILIDPKVTLGARHFSYKAGASRETWHRFKASPLVRYVRALRWTPIPLGLGFAYIAYQQFRHVRKRELAKISTASFPTELLASDFEVSLYKMLPLRATSRFWGWVNSINLPGVIRKPILKIFIHTYGCNIAEATDEDLDNYHNLGEFFSRHLKPEVRPIHPGNVLVSPSDGTILHFGKIENGLVEQVKGVTYSLRSFLGPYVFKNGKKRKIDSDEEYQQQLLSSPDNALYHCVVYLAPGDYHKFHSPTDWMVQQRRHFSGELFSVRPGFVNWIAGLFNLNERVVYTGIWKHGFFSLTAVGATNVGSIRVFFDESLETNKKKCSKGHCNAKTFSSEEKDGIPVQKGSLFGEFNLGSTVVLIFEAPKNITFNVGSGQKTKYGELISFCNSNNCDAA